MAPIIPSSGLRSRKIDHKKPITVYSLADLPDYDLSLNIQRSMTISTGVEKEEEEEHHLQAALNASYIGLPKSVVIPTPDASRFFQDYDRYYNKDFTVPKTLIKFSSLVEECIGCNYSIDKLDSNWLAQYNNTTSPSESISIDDFENIMTAMERFANERLGSDTPDIDELHTFYSHSPLNFSKHKIETIFPYWLNRRLSNNQNVPIIPRIKTEENGIKTENDPYICFRKRELKSLRKRGRDGAALDKLTRLRSELYRIREILELVSQRETLRKQTLNAEKDIFVQRVIVRRLKKKLGIVTDKDVESSPERKRKKDALTTKIRIPLHKYKDALNDSHLRLQLEVIYRLSMIQGTLLPFLESVSIEEEIKQKKLKDLKEGWIDATEDTFQPYNNMESDDFWTPKLGPTKLFHSSNHRNLGRKRYGRGGRLFIDQHLHRRELKCIFNESNHMNTKGKSSKSKPSTYTSGNDSSESGKQTSWDKFIKKWDFDNSDEDVDICPSLTEESVLEEKAIDFAWRSFNLCATTDIECRNLITKPAFPEQNNPQPLPLGTRAQDLVAPPQIVRQPLNTPTTNTTSIPKRKPSRSSDVKANLLKKKPVENLDPRAATVKAMMQQAQRQAQQTQIQIQQYSSTPSVPSGRTPVNSGSNNSSMPSSPKESLDSITNKPDPNAVGNKLQRPPARMGYRMQQPPIPQMTQAQMQQAFYYSQQQQLMMAQSQGRGRPIVPNPLSMQVPMMQGSPLSEMQKKTFLDNPNQMIGAGQWSLVGGEKYADPNANMSGFEKEKKEK